MRALWQRLFGHRLPKFKPHVGFNEAMKITDIVLKDTSIVWCPYGDPNTVDLGYDFDGNLVAVQIWEDVRFRPTRT
jgi:hypothetical protein